ncbi:hypothetical protein Tco_0379494 [Tanacetum coccineum]
MDGCILSCGTRDDHSPQDTIEWQIQTAALFKIRVHDGGVPTFFLYILPDSYHLHLRLLRLHSGCCCFCPSIQDRGLGDLNQSVIPRLDLNGLIAPSAQSICNNHLLSTG